MIELQQLRQLICIVEEGTISKAADKLILSQPALSRSMQRLEADLGVSLFEHHKNKIVLNENGKRMVKHAKRVIKQMDDIVLDVQNFDALNKTLVIASCTPAPLWDIEPLLRKSYPQTKIKCEMKNEEELKKGLDDGRYQMTITPWPMEEKGYVSIPYLEEDLFISLSENHRLANCKEVHFSDFEGETMILYSNIGYWFDLHQRMMPNTKFLLQNERSTFKEIVKASTLPSFTSNLSIKREGKTANRVIIPLADEEAHVTFYLSALSKNKMRYQDFFKVIEDYYDY